MAVSRYFDLRDAVRQTQINTTLSSLRAGYQMARAQWLVAGSPGSGNVGVLSDLNVEGVTVRFRNGHPHTTRGAHVPAGTPNRNNAATRLFFTFLSQPTDVIGRNNRSDTGWVMDRNASCANVAPRNRRSCWLYRVEGQDYARITYSVLSGQFSVNFL